MTRKKLDFEYLRNLAEYSLYANTFGTGDNFPKKPTIKQFCDEIRAEMEYQYECDVRDGLA